MNEIGKKERVTQDRVVAMLRDRLGYRYLGNWTDRPGNANVDEELLRAALVRRGVSAGLISKAVHQLVGEAGHVGRSLYEANQRVYSLLRYGVDVSPEVGEHKETVALIDWAHPEKNDFAFAEEVTVRGQNTKRPDIVIYVNGIAVGVLELKRSTVSVSEGIRQNLDNQSDRFIKAFFSTIQLVLAGNDSEGLRYGTIETKEKYYLEWKELGDSAAVGEAEIWKQAAPVRELMAGVAGRLDRSLIQMLYRPRFLELMHDFVAFDRGIKKVCRHNQYFGLKAAQFHVRRYEGGIVWHTQGSGKSLTMVWLTKWIFENVPEARVLIVTDREELDEQIEKVFKGVQENIRRTHSGKDLIRQLNDPVQRLICSLIHKFRGGKKDTYKAYIEEIVGQLPNGFHPKGRFFVFVDECHRTQSGKLHEAMTTILPEAVLIGFTGTPLLKADKKKSIEVFGGYIHTYRYDEAVTDGVVLDLRYEARDVEQKITSMEKIDQWFELKTRGLTEFARAQLKEKWGTMRKVFSSKGRLEKIVADILLDMETKERLQNGRGNALLVSGSIYQACRYYELFQRAGFTKCAIVTSFVPKVQGTKGEETGEGQTEKLEQYEIYRKMLSDHLGQEIDENCTDFDKKVDTFEKKVKSQFVDEPAQMKLLIVVDKLLTGFDAPSATYLYIDKIMHDHGLFQAICRVNRLDGEDKRYGYVVDYRDLFRSLEQSVKDYTGEAFAEYDKEDVAGLIQDRRTQAKQDLDDALEAIRELCEPVAPPKDEVAYVRYFCGDTQDASALKETEPRRVALYKTTTAVIRAYAAVADEMPEVGYTAKQSAAILKEVQHFEKVRQVVQLASGDYIDLKSYEPAMRHLIDAYIGAEESQIMSQFGEMTLVDLVVNRGADAMDVLAGGVHGDKRVVAETIENNLRRVIIEESATNPAYYTKMSELLDELIRQRNSEAVEYQEYLERIRNLARKVKHPELAENYPVSIQTAPQRALYDALSGNEALAVAIDQQVLATRKDGWRGHPLKERQVEIAVKKTLEKFGASSEQGMTDLLELIRNQREY